MIIPAYICDVIRTPVGECGGMLSAVRADDLAALPLMALMERHSGVDWEQVGTVMYGCGGGGNGNTGNIARVAGLLAGLPPAVPGVAIPCQDGSDLQVAGMAAQAIRCGDTGLMIAGGVASISRSQVSGDSGNAAAVPQDTGPHACWHAGHPILKAEHGHDSFLRSAEQIAREFGIERVAQDRFAMASRQKALAAARQGRFEEEVTPVTVAGRNGDAMVASSDELPRRLSGKESSVQQALPGDGSPAMAGNAAARADGACALLLACEKSAQRYSLLPKARLLAVASAGVPPRLAGMAAALAARKALVQAGLNMDQMEVIELHEAIAAWCIAVLRDWGLQDDDARVNQNGGAIALGDPSGASGVRLAVTATCQLHRIKARYALCAASTAAGQGFALIIERV